MRAIALRCLLLLAVLPLSACGTSPFAYGSPAAQVGSSADVTFSGCPRTAPRPGTTNLDPVPRIDARNASDPPAVPMPHGIVVLEQPVVLHLRAGTLGAGAGYDAASALAPTLRVADGAVDAPVTLAILDSPTAGRRVAFAEVVVGGGVPVRWADVRDLQISTDGGDGGFVPGDAPQAPNFDVEAYSAAYDDARGGVCVLRRSAGTDAPDAVIFSTGYGDGGYPTFAGYDASGRVVSLVNYGYVLPWRYSGLPGSPPTSPEVGGVPYASLPPSGSPSPTSTPRS